MPGLRWRESELTFAATPSRVYPTARFCEVIEAAGPIRWRSELTTNVFAKPRLNTRGYSVWRSARPVVSRAEAMEKSEQAAQWAKP